MIFWSEASEDHPPLLQHHQTQHAPYVQFDDFCSCSSSCATQHIVFRQTHTQTRRNSLNGEEIARALERINKKQKKKIIKTTITEVKQRNNLRNILNHKKANANMSAKLPESELEGNAARETVGKGSPGNRDRGVSKPIIHEEAQRGNQRCG